jgi:hypothetical protein
MGFWKQSLSILTGAASKEEEAKVERAIPIIERVAGRTIDPKGKGWLLAAARLNIEHGWAENEYGYAFLYFYKFYLSRGVSGDDPTLLESSPEFKRKIIQSFDEHVASGHIFNMSSHINDYRKAKDFYGF